MKSRSLDDQLLRDLVREYGTPLYVYHADIVRQRIQDLRGFDVIRYAQKANPNLGLLRWLRGSGVKVDTVSAGEVYRALKAGFTEEEIVFTADLFDHPILDLLGKYDLHVNLGSPDMVEQYAALRQSSGQAPSASSGQAPSASSGQAPSASSGQAPSASSGQAPSASSGQAPSASSGQAPSASSGQAVRPGQNVTLRINPGFGHGHDRRVNTGGPESKHGIWHEQLSQVLERAARAGLTVTGVHMHIGSGSDFKHLSRVRQALSTAALMAADTVTTISAGGGLPIPYHPDESAFDVVHFVQDWQETKSELEDSLGRPLTMEVEPGRYLLAEAGLLLTEVRGTKTSGPIDYILVDAGFDNLVRPAMYGAYHHISIIGRDNQPTAPRVVAGPLCESADMFTQERGGFVKPRPLPEAQVGDFLCIHDVGAYGASMASNYNARPLAAEVLVEGKSARLVRRRQTLDDMIAWEIDLP